VAVLVGCLLDGEQLTGWIVGGITVILAGVALVRSSEHRRRRTEKPPHPTQRRSAQRGVPLEIDGPVTGSYGKIGVTTSGKIADPL
jgi:hypothetical protein